MKIRIESPEERDQLRIALASHEAALRTVINRQRRRALPETLAALEITSGMRRRWFPAKKEQP